IAASILTEASNSIIIYLTSDINGVANNRTLSEMHELGVEWGEVAPSQLPQQHGPVSNTNTAVQRLLQDQQQGKEPTSVTHTRPAAQHAMEHVPLTVEEGNLALVAVIFLVCTVEVMLIKAVTELSPSSVQALPLQLVRDDPSVAYLTGQYERPYLDDEDFDIYGEIPAEDCGRGATPRPHGLKKVTWPPPPEDIADGEQEPVYAQEAPAVNGFASPAPHYAQQVSRQGRPPQQQQQQQQTPPAQRRSASRDRRSPAWTPPPTLITLRQSPPIHQEPAPVVVSQPATAMMQAPVQNGHLSRTNSTPGSAASSPVPVPGPAGVAPKPTRVTAKNRGDLKWPPEVVEIIPETITFEIPLANQEEPIVRQSGVRARGDAKWPPQEYKTRADEENAQRVALAKGPVCRPRLPKRDYSSFFEQNRVNSMYPGYRPPPGTQHYVDETGVSEF
ncbi:Chitobiosyldiphosphodolichol beta-mannosyltransferase, partial [Frankliniella fusca]